MSEKFNVEIMYTSKLCTFCNGQIKKSSMSNDNNEGGEQKQTANELHAVSGSKKRRRNSGYIDRNQVMAAGRRMPQIIPHIHAVEDKKTNRKYQFACKCNYKLTYMEPTSVVISTITSSISVAAVDSNPGEHYHQSLSTPNDDHIIVKHKKKAILDVLVLDNNICILVLKDPVLDCIKNIQFSSTLDTDKVSGRMKKGAIHVQAGAVLCTIWMIDHSHDEADADVKLLGSDTSSTTEDDNVRIGIGMRSLQLISPIGGKLLELNTSLLEPAHYQLLTSIKSYNHEGYIGVLYPDTELPSLIGYRDSDSLLSSYRHPSRVPGVCYDFLSGACKRGSLCRFKHISSEEVNEQV